MSDEREFTDEGGRRLHSGEVVDVDRRRFRFADGEEVDRDVVRHPGGVAIVAHDGASVLLVRQPRPAVGERGLVALPAGRMDHEDEDLGHAEADSGERERIEVVEWPLERLDDAIADNRDPKTLIGLLMLRDRLR